ncbi:MAG: 2-phosphosulfolactate phosphatase [Actinomycetota bacterium]|nr:2-phosphosulfolactate phosphatase [Actinomycetota bacterium]
MAFTPAGTHPAATAVVLDVLRATSTIVQALAGGYERVLCCGDKDRARELRGPERALAGEEDSRRPEDFDLGNSPEEVVHPRARELVLATTNGSPAIVGAADVADEVLLGSLLNLEAVLRALEGKDDVLVICSGTDGRVTLEDVYVAGRVSARLEGERGDAALVAESVARAHADARSALAASAHAQTLREAGLEADVDWCAQESVLECVPRVSEVRDGVAVVEVGAREPVSGAESAATGAGGGASAGRGW